MKKNIKFIFYIILIFFGFLSKVSGERLDLKKVKFIDINGEEFSLDTISSNLILIVNTASFCGFTKQYSDLQDLRNKYNVDQLFIIAIPSNDFGGQEPGSELEIKDFCELNYGITFPIMSKQQVVGSNKHYFYELIEKNYGYKFLPKWNFHKYLIKNDGTLIKSYSSHISPTSNKFISSIEENL